MGTGEAPSINQVTKYVEFPQTQYTDKVITVHLVILRLVPQFQIVLKTVKVPQVQFICRAVDVPVVGQRQVFQLQTVAKTVEALPTQFVGIVVVLWSQHGNLRPTWRAC